MAKKKAELRPGLAADPNRASFEPALVNQPHFSSRNSGSDAGDIAHAAVADAASVGSPGSALASSAKFLLENAQQIWDQAVATVEDMTADHAKAAAEIAIRAPNQLAVIFGAKYNFSKTFCERPDRAAKLEEAVAACMREGMSRMDALKEVARKRGLSKRDVYRATQIAKPREVE